MGERERLVTRIWPIRRAAVAATSPPQANADLGPNETRAMKARIDHLEKLVEALQDSMYRESERQSKRIAELEAQIHPAALGAALSRDARERGL